MCPMCLLALICSLVLAIIGVIKLRVKKIGAVLKNIMLYIKSVIIRYNKSN